MFAKIWGLTFFFISFGLAFADQAPLVLHLNYCKVKNIQTENGTKEVCVSIKKGVYPKDTIEYRIEAFNNSTQPLKDIYIYGRIPAGTSYVPGSASGKPQFSIDHGKNFSYEPVRYKVVEGNKTVEKVATPDMYTDIRWFVPLLKPHEKKVFKYRVRVD